MYDTSRSHNELGINEAKLVDDFDVIDVQDWRVTQGKSSCHERRSPSQPGSSSDIWSVGCLLTEALSGHKLYQTGDKLATVLRPSQLLEMKLGNTEITWSDRGERQTFLLIKDLILKCINESPSDRITAAEALGHQLFELYLEPSTSESVLLQSPALKFSRCSYDNTEKHDGITEDMLHQLRAECEAYGEIIECKIVDGGFAIVHFEEVRQAVFARNILLKILTGKRTDNSFYIESNNITCSSKNVVWDITFYPLELLRNFC